MNGNAYKNRWTDPDEVTAPKLVKIVGDIAGVPMSKGHGKHKGDVVSLDFVKPGKRLIDDKGRDMLPWGDQIVNGRRGELLSATEVLSGLYLTRAQLALHGYSKSEVADAYAAISQDPIRRRKLHLMELGEAISKRNIHPSLLKHGATGDDGRTYDPTEVLEALRKLPPEEMKRISEADVISPEHAALLNGTHRTQVEAIVKAASK